MLSIRRFECRVEQLLKENRIYGPAHLYIGEEAVAAGVCANLRTDDYVASTHRGHGHLIAKGGQFHSMMAELFARSTGYCKGKGGSMHIADMTRMMLGANGIVGAGISLATGAALAARVRGTDQVSVCFFGDGASNQGAFLEAINIAATMNLPVVYVCENNGYGVNTKWATISGHPDIADRAIGLGLPGKVVDGQDVTSVYEAAAEAIKRARRAEGPTLLECKTYRYRGHCGVWGDPRDPAEIAEWEDRDPIPMFARTLVAEGVATEEQLQDMEQALERELDAAVKFAEDSPPLEPAEATTDVYAETSLVVDKTDQISPTEAAPDQDLVSKYWEETDQ
ncbi:thiamine pyrophosphate-dependent dehydrogenase E1 component subunit alpha [Candidatus Poribacteria bacterium]